MPVRRAPADLTHLRASVGNELTKSRCFPWIPLRRGSFLKSGTASELDNDGLYVIPATLRK